MLTYIPEGCERRTCSSMQLPGLRRAFVSATTFAVHHPHQQAVVLQVHPFRPQLGMPLCPSLRHLYSYTLSVRQMLAPPTTIPLRLPLFLHTVAPEWLCDPPLLNFQNPPPTCCLSERLTPFSILLLRPPHYQAPVSLLQRSGGVCTDGSHSHANLSPLPAPQPSLLNPFSDIATPEHHHGLVYF